MCSCVCMHVYAGACMCIFVFVQATCARVSEPPSVSLTTSFIEAKSLNQTQSSPKWLISLGNSSADHTSSPSEAGTIHKLLQPFSIYMGSEHPKSVLKLGKQALNL